jgi:hypothetical protein
VLHKITVDESGCGYGGLECVGGGVFIQPNSEREDEEV